MACSRGSTVQQKYDSARCPLPSWQLSDSDQGIFGKLCNLVIACNPQIAVGDHMRPSDRTQPPSALVGAQVQRCQQPADVGSASRGLLCTCQAYSYMASADCGTFDATELVCLLVPACDAQGGLLSARLLAARILGR
jgi:hypothetical protein